MKLCSSRFVMGRLTKESLILAQTHTHALPIRVPPCRCALKYALSTVFLSTYQVTRQLGPLPTDGQQDCSDALREASAAVEEHRDIIETKLMGYHPSLLYYHKHLSEPFRCVSHLKLAVPQLMIMK